MHLMQWFLCHEGDLKVKVSLQLKTMITVITLQFCYILHGLVFAFGTVKIMLFVN